MIKWHDMIKIVNSKWSSLDKTQLDKYHTEQQNKNQTAGVSFEYRVTLYENGIRNSSLLRYYTVQYILLTPTANNHDKVTRHD
jgi:hypothetical protein